MPSSKYWPASHCARCHAELRVGSTMSKFNTDQICMACKQDEKEAPNYRKADDAEVAQVRQGNYNYEGIGLAPEDIAFLVQRREARVPTTKG